MKSKFQELLVRHVNPLFLSKSCDASPRYGDRSSPSDFDGPYPSLRHGMVEEDYEPPHLLTPFLTDKAGNERKAILNLEWIYKRLLSLTFHLNKIKIMVRCHF